jgi:ABC-type microcin C transport system duplicated ATPase subunit YejF
VCDVAAVRQLSDDIAVLKDGELAETGPSKAFFIRPIAAYFRDLPINRGHLKRFPWCVFGEEG